MVGCSNQQAGSGDGFVELFLSLPQGSSRHAHNRPFSSIRHACYREEESQTSKGTAGPTLLSFRIRSTYPSDR